MLFGQYLMKYKYFQYKIKKKEQEKQKITFFHIFFALFFTYLKGVLYGPFSSFLAVTLYILSCNGCATEDNQPLDNVAQLSDIATPTPIG